MRKVEIEPYSDAWPSAFAEIRAVLADALGPLALRIDHIGSTAVPGLPAKNVIDVQVTVADLGAADALVAAGFRPLRLAAHMPDTMTYADVKDPAVDLIALAAEDWAAATGWRPGPSDA